ncbi:MAG: hypothetical protein JWL84_2552 [Rhodospirillales bacterium]|nr:hypothetical protein [Rhodospirillales bacterium]
MIDCRNRRPRRAGGRLLAAAAAHFLCVLLVALAARAAVAAPPAGTIWAPSFAAEFAGAALPDGWSPLDRPGGALDSARAVGNVVAGDGGVRLVARLVEAGGWHWTTALLRAPALRQASGYVEAEIRIAGATGLGSRFALVGVAPSGAETPAGKTAVGGVAIGIQAQYPDTLVMTLRGVASPVMQRIRTRGIDLSAGFHRYGIEFAPNERGSTTITWYFDDLRVGSADCAACAEPMSPEFSTSVSINAKVAGPATVALDGKSMDVAALRAYRPKDPAGGEAGMAAGNTGSDRDMARRDAALLPAGSASLK